MWEAARRRGQAVRTRDRTSPRPRALYDLANVTLTLMGSGFPMHKMRLEDALLHSLIVRQPSGYHEQTRWVARNVSPEVLWVPVKSASAHSEPRRPGWQDSGQIPRAGKPHAEPGRLPRLGPSWPGALRRLTLICALVPQAHRKAYVVRLCGGAAGVHGGLLARGPILPRARLCPSLPHPLTRGSIAAGRGDFSGSCFVGFKFQLLG